jgi:hypothetical protein
MNEVSETLAVDRERGDTLIGAIKTLVGLAESNRVDFFDGVHAIALIFPRYLKVQLSQLVRGPVWDGDVISKSHRGVLFEMDIAIRVCCKGEQGYTGAKYIGYSILNKMNEAA